MSRSPDCWALFLDFDGTLVDIAADPNSISVPIGLPPLLRSVSAALNGALAILTGRPIRVIDTYLRPLKLPMAGGHGAERRETPFGPIVSISPPLDPHVEALVGNVRKIHPGIRIETKYASIAVHYRSAEPALGEIEAALQEIVAPYGEHLILCPGRKVIEIAPRNVSKGAALGQFMTSASFRGRIPMVVGDDVSDQSAFDMARRLGGASKRVAGEHFSLSDAEFQSPTHVRAWLTTLVAGVEA